MAFDPDGMTAFEMVAILKRVKLPDRTRLEVSRLASRMKGGLLDLDDKRWLRATCKKHAKRIQEMLDAEELARMNMAAERAGTSLATIKQQSAAKRLAEAFAKKREERTNPKSEYGF